MWLTELTELTELTIRKIHTFQYCPYLTNKGAERCMRGNHMSFLLHWLYLPVKYRNIYISNSTKIYFTYQRFPFLFCFLCFRPVYGLASRISLCTPFSTVLLLLRPIHLGWCFTLSPITMATAAVGCHWSLYNIPGEAQAKTVDKKRVEPAKRVKRQGWDLGDVSKQW